MNGVARGATVLPIRVAGWQREAAGAWAVYGRTDQLVAGLERAVDPNADGVALDAARVALVGVAEPFAAFEDSPRRAQSPAHCGLDTLVVATGGERRSRRPRVRQHLRAGRVARGAHGRRRRPPRLAVSVQSSSGPASACSSTGGAARGRSRLRREALPAVAPRLSDGAEEASPPKLGDFFDERASASSPARRRSSRRAPIPAYAASQAVKAGARRSSSTATRCREAGSASTKT